MGMPKATREHLAGLDPLQQRGCAPAATAPPRPDGQPEQMEAALRAWRQMFGCCTSSADLSMMTQRWLGGRAVAEANGPLPPLIVAVAGSSDGRSGVER
jgi:hypothetical protein